MSELSQVIEQMRNMRENYDALATAAEAYNTGKEQLAENITSKGVQASASETLPELAEKVRAISQESYTIDGGEMYAKQIYGSLTPPNFWNLYEVMAQLLSDGRLVNYGGILLAEYYKGYDSLALAGAGTGGAYVVSDKDANGQYIMYTTDTTHFWNDDLNNKGNRWVAYCFDGDWHDFQITDTNISPRAVCIGRKVGTIKSLVNSRISSVSQFDGSQLMDMNGAFVHQFAGNVALSFASKGDGISLRCNASSNYYIKIGDFDRVSGSAYVLDYSPGSAYSGTIIFDIENGETPNSIGSILFGSDGGALNYTGNIIVRCKTKFKGSICSLYLNSAAQANAIGVCICEIEDIVGGGLSYNRYLFAAQGFRKIYFIGLEQTTYARFHNNKGFTQYIYIGYKTNDRNRNVLLASQNKMPILTDIELQDGYKKNCDVSQLTDNLTAENIALHMLDRLADNTGEETLTLTIGASNLATILADETYASYVTAAQAKNWTIA